MKEYELLLILRPNLGDDRNKELVSLTQSWITEKSGEITLSNEWGMQELETEFDKCTQGYYYQAQFNGTNETLDNLAEKFHVTEDILRHMIVTMDSIRSKNIEKEAVEA